MDGIIIFYAALIVALTGLFIGVFLEFSGKKLHVEVDQRIEDVTNVLPGNNCGGCGYPGCANLAGAIVSGDARVNACPVGGATVASMVGEIMGIKSEASDPLVAFVHCSGTCEKAKQDYIYTGQNDCQMVKAIANGGPKACNFGCLGFGTCVEACSFGAISIKDGIAVVDEKKCKACGACVSVCPQNLISLVKQKQTTRVVCNSRSKGKEVIISCSAGCIGCGICAKMCPQGAIEIVDNLPVIDSDKCINCGTCVAKCPKKCIREIKEK